MGGLCTRLKGGWPVLPWLLEREGWAQQSPCIHTSTPQNACQKHGPRPVEAHPQSAEQRQTNQMSYFQKRDGPLRFFLADCLLNATAASAQYDNSQAVR